jgi:hypothetical protein
MRIHPRKSSTLYLKSFGAPRFSRNTVPISPRIKTIIRSDIPGMIYPHGINQTAVRPIARA